MATLPNAPLVEVIFEMRWGQVKKSGSNIAFEFPSREVSHFQGGFAKTVELKGFKLHEDLGNPEFPHLVLDRYRKEVNTWPCYQVGRGIFTVNQVVEGYKWVSFKNDVIEGLKFIQESYPGGLASVPLIGVELRYQDGLILKTGQSATDFLTENINVNFSAPQQFLSSPLLTNNIDNHSLSFSVQTKTPSGRLIISLNKAFVNGREGFAMDVVVRSSDNDKPKLIISEMSEWLEKAHVLQEHSFTTLIEDKYMKTFKG